ncbi:MAG: hypothetical protein AAGH92_05840 [Planctomycetota bacterium]
MDFDPNAPLTQHDVDALQERLEDLRGTMVRSDACVADRVDHLRRDTNRLLKRAAGTDFEPAMQSVANLLDCLRRGMNAQAELNRTARAVA